MVIVSKAQRVLGFEIRKKLGKPGDPDPYDVLGIYQIRHYKKYTRVVKEKFYNPGPPTHQGQLDAQDKFRAGVLAWQALTESQKQVYNDRTKRKEMYGFNLFLREYMLA